LTEIAGSPFASGPKPYSITIDPTGKFAYVTNQYTANISAFSINAATGALTEIAGSPFGAGKYPLSVITVHVGQ
jgi:DNA-binding beta-propeller fold protein YncE